MWSYSEEVEAWKSYCKYKDILKDGGFNFRKYQTNGVSKESVDSKEKDQSYAKATLGSSCSVHQQKRF